MAFDNMIFITSSAKMLYSLKFVIIKYAFVNEISAVTSFVTKQNITTEQTVNVSPC
jgi:hypothetical protein